MKRILLVLAILLVFLPAKVNAQDDSCHGEWLDTINNSITDAREKFHNVAGNPTPPDNRTFGEMILSIEIAYAVAADTDVPECAEPFAVAARDLAFSYHAFSMNIVMAGTVLTQEGAIRRIEPLGNLVSQMQRQYDFLYIQLSETEEEPTM